MNATHVFLTFFALLLAQLAVPFDLQFVQGRNFVSPVMLVFGGLAAGQLIYLLLLRGRAQALALTHPAILSLLLAPLFLTFGHWPAGAPVAAVLIFTIFGLAISRIYGMHRLAPTVRASAAAGVAAALAFPITSSVDTEYLKIAVVAIFGASAFFEPPRPRLWPGLGAAVLALAFLQAPLFPGVLLKASNKAIYQYEGPTYFAPLLRTDFYRETLRNYLVIVTNGIHFAIVNKHGGDEDQLPVELHTKNGTALVIGSASGRRINMLLNSGYSEVTAVDLNPNVFKAMIELEGENSVYRDPRVKSVVAEGRHFLHQHKNTKFDLILIDKVKLGEPVGSISPHFEDFLYTQEALEQMWSILSEQGIIFFRENMLGRRFALTQKIFIEELARAARCSAKMPGANILTFGGWMEVKARSERPYASRATMTISKNRLPIQSMENGELTLLPVDTQADCAKVVSDERPFHSNQASHRPMYLWALLISLLPVALLAWNWDRVKPAKNDALAFTAGLVYIVWLVGATGLLFLFIENPALISPVTLFTSFAAGVLCFHLPVSNPRVLRAVAGLAFVAAPLVFMLVANKNHFLAQTGWSAPLLVLLLFAPGFILVETPYMTVIRRSPNTVRVLIFENWGCLVAIPLCYLVKVHLGFVQIALAALVFSAILCLLLAHDHRKR